MDTQYQINFADYTDLRIYIVNGIKAVSFYIELRFEVEE